MNEYERQTRAAGDQEIGAGRERTPEEIEREIEMTRERMSRDIDALGEKLSPQNLKRQAKEAISGKAQDMVNNVGDQARDTGSRLIDFVRENPLPVVAAGLGAVWLIRQRNRSDISGDRMARFAYTGPERRGGGIRERISERTEGIRERAEDLRERAGDLGRGARERLGERLGDISSSARRQGSRARGGIQNMMEDNPLAVAAGAAVLGLCLGLLVPETEPENRWMGPTRDNLVDRAQATASRVKDAALEATNEVREAVKEEATSHTPEVLKAAAKDVAASVAREVKDAAGRVKEEAKQAAKESGTRGSTQA
jgi:ElaB/YqjD/DUF883 family membrane-anchored ribosome-binding protein